MSPPIDCTKRPESIPRRSSPAIDRVFCKRTAQTLKQAKGDYADKWKVYPRVLVATALQAQEEGITALKKSRTQLHEEGTYMITQALNAAQFLMKEQIIPPLLWDLSYSYARHRAR